MPVLADRTKLLNQAADGNATAAATLIRVYKLNTIGLLVGAIWPLGNPPAAGFDLCADALAAAAELDELKKEHA